MTAPGTDIVIVLAAGGTGGHLFPAEAVADALARRGVRPILVTDRRGGVFALGDETVEVHRIRAENPSAGGVARRAAAALALAAGTLDAWRLLGRLRPAAVVGFGGYPALPTVLAARARHVPTLIHEQNARLGRANRLMARIAGAVAASFETVEGLPEGVAMRLTGNPVRAAVLALRDAGYAAPTETGALRLLVTGGSQGAAVFSRLVPAALAALPEALRARMAVTQQSRPELLEETRAAYAEAGLDATVESFFDDLPARLAAAHLVLCRAGASTVAELGVVGRPALLVPYPHAMDDHQAANARAFTAAGGGAAVAEAGLDVAALSGQLAAWLRDPVRLAGAAAAAHAFGRPDAAERLADLALAGAGRAAGAGSAAPRAGDGPTDATLRERLA